MSKIVDNGIGIGLYSGFYTSLKSLSMDESQSSLLLLSCLESLLNSLLFESEYSKLSSEEMILSLGRDSKVTCTRTCESLIRVDVSSELVAKCYLVSPFTLYEILGYNFGFCCAFEWPFMRI